MKNEKTKGEKKKEKSFHEKWREDKVFRKALQNQLFFSSILFILFIVFPILLFKLYKKDILLLPPTLCSLKQAHIDFIIAFSLIFGVVGAVFAIWAQRSAFNAEKEAIGIRQDIPIFFNYKDGLPKIIELIQEAENELYILSPIPTYGLIPESLGKGKGFCHALNQILNNMKYKQNSKIIMICNGGDKDYTNFCDNIKNIDKLWFNNYKSEARTILEKIRDLGKNGEFYGTSDKWIRIFISEKRAIILVIPNYGEKSGEFASAGFETKSDKMIATFKILFDNYLNKEKSPETRQLTDFSELAINKYLETGEIVVKEQEKKTEIQISNNKTSLLQKIFSLFHRKNQ